MSAPPVRTRGGDAVRLGGACTIGGPALPKMGPEEIAVRDLCGRVRRQLVRDYLRAVFGGRRGQET